eukprot:6196872-Pleurochrysis_carterae.AAC.4
MSSSSMGWCADGSKLLAPRAVIHSLPRSLRIPGLIFLLLTRCNLDLWLSESAWQPGVTVHGVPPLPHVAQRPVLPPLPFFSGGLLRGLFDAAVGGAKGWVGLERVTSHFLSAAIFSVLLNWFEPCCKHSRPSCDFPPLATSSAARCSRSFHSRCI